MRRAAASQARGLRRSLWTFPQCRCQAATQLFPVGVAGMDRTEIPGRGSRPAPRPRRGPTARPCERPSGASGPQGMPVAAFPGEAGGKHSGAAVHVHRCRTTTCAFFCRLDPPRSPVQTPAPLAVQHVPVLSAKLRHPARFRRAARLKLAGGYHDGVCLRGDLPCSAGHRTPRPQRGGRSGRAGPCRPARCIAQQAGGPEPQAQRRLSSHRRPRPADRDRAPVGIRCLGCSLAGLFPGRIPLLHLAAARAPAPSLGVLLHRLPHRMRSFLRLSLDVRRRSAPPNEEVSPWLTRSTTPASRPATPALTRATTAPRPAFRSRT